MCIRVLPPAIALAAIAPSAIGWGCLESARVAALPEMPGANSVLLAVASSDDARTFAFDVTGSRRDPALLDVRGTAMEAALHPRSLDDLGLIEGEIITRPEQETRSLIPEPVFFRMAPGGAWERSDVPPPALAALRLPSLCRELDVRDEGFEFSDIELGAPDVTAAGRFGPDAALIAFGGSNTPTIAPRLAYVAIDGEHRVLTATMSQPAFVILTVADERVWVIGFQGQVIALDPARGSDSPIETLPPVPLQPGRSIVHADASPPGAPMEVIVVDGAGEVFRWADSGPWRSVGTAAPAVSVLWVAPGTALISQSAGSGRMFAIRNGDIEVIEPEGVPDELQEVRLRSNSRFGVLIAGYVPGLHEHLQLWHYFRLRDDWTRADELETAPAIEPVKLEHLAPFRHGFLIVSNREIREHQHALCSTRLLINIGDHRPRAAVRVRDDLTMVVMEKPSGERPANGYRILWISPRSRE